MQKYEEKPIPVVFRQENGKYQVNQEAIELFSSVEGKLAIISVAGVYRTGKSFLLNTMLLNCKNGFAVGPTVNPKTKGIWVWAKPLIFKNQKDEIINVFILDSEGLGSTEQDANHDLRLFSITLLLSSAFMYNTVGSIDENAIDRLGLVLRLCDHLKNDSFNDFPDFHWILRDFSLALVDKNNAPLTTKEYLQNCLSNQTGDSQYRNLIRQSIKQAFEVRNCSTFVRPLLNQEQLQCLDKMELEQLRPEFVEQVIDFRKSIFGNLRIKSIKGRDINGKMLCELVRIYVECINSDKLPVIENGWQQLCLKELHEVLFDIEQAIAKRVREMKQRLPRTKNQLVKEQQLLMKEFQQIFSKRLKNNDKARQYFNSVEEIITKQLQGIEDEMKIKNTNQNQIFMKKQFEGIQKRLKQAEFKSMGQLAKEFQIFYEYYKKKCPYKDELEAGHEMLMKKFSECSLIFFKSAQNKKDTQIEQLKEQMCQMVTDFNSKQQKYKEEKNKFQDLNAKLQTNLFDMKKQNDEMSAAISELQGKLQISENINNNDMEEDISHQNILLKKKIMDLEDKQRELDCLHSQEQSILKQEILLKNNQSQNYEKLNSDLTAKILELEQLFRNCKQTNEQKINELLLQLNNASQTASQLQKVLKSKLAEREQIIDELQKTVDMKNEQILEMSNRTTNQNSVLAEFTMQEEKRFIEEREKQLTDLKSQHNQVKETLQRRVNELQSQIASKQTEFRIWKLELQQSKALLTQRIEFITKQSDEKKDKNNTLQQEISNYVQMIEQKDQYIEQLTNQIQELKNYELTEGEQIEKKISEFVGQLDIKNNQIKSLQSFNESIRESLNKKVDEKTFKINEMQVLLDKSEEECRALQNKIIELKSTLQDKERYFEDSLQQNRAHFQKDIEQQKRAAEMSLCQLKNYFEMEKERLQKRILQERKKSEYNENNLTIELKNKYTKQIKALTEQSNQYAERIQQLEEDLIKTKNEYEVKFIGQDEEIQNQKRAFENKYESLKRKYDEASEELNKIEKKHEEDRISFVKRIEALSFEISKRQKQMFELGKKKQSLESVVNKKDSQIENIKKIMHQQIESSLKKVSETQEKYQKVNEQYVKFRMEAEKQNALLNQKNQFLNARLEDMNKEKQPGSMKNFDKIQKNKIVELKEQLERQKSENISLETKIENLRKADKESSNQHRKQFNEIEKENLILKQKIDIYETKIGQLETKINQKTQLFKRQVQDMRVKFTADRTKLQNDIDLQKQKLQNSQEEKNQKIFKLQMDLALIQDKMLYAESQRDQNKKQLEETEKRLQNALNQAKKQNQKGLDMSQNKKNSVDKRYCNQLELMKISSKVRQEQLEETNRKMKQQNKSLKDKNFELQEKLNIAQKCANHQRNLNEQIYQLKRQKEELNMAHRNQFAKQNDESKKRFAEIERRNRELDSKNNKFVFELQKQKAKANLEKSALLQKLKELEDQLAWEKKKSEPQIRTQASKSKLLSMSSSDVMGNYK